MFCQRLTRLKVPVADQPDKNLMITFYRLLLDNCEQEFKIDFVAEAADRQKATRSFPVEVGLLLSDYNPFTPS